MHSWCLVPVLLLVSTIAHAADACPRLAAQTSATDPATRIAAVACREHALWFRPFIDREGRMASSTVVEAETLLLTDGETPVWQQVARYWHESGLLRQAAHLSGAAECTDAIEKRYPSAACRTFVVDNPWSATFVSWVMQQARLPGFRASMSHIAYIRDVHRRPQSSAHQLVDIAGARPAAGDLLCHVRQRGHVFGYAGLLARVSNHDDGLDMHCDIVVAVNPGNDSTAYLIGGNVQQGVTMRLLPLNRNGEFWGLPQRADGEAPCSPDNETACNFNRQDWAVLLKLKPAEELARLAGALSPAEPAPLPTDLPECCVHCVVGSDVPRCPRVPGNGNVRE